MTRADLKAAAKEKLRGNWGWGALVVLILSVVAFFVGIFPFKIVACLISSFLTVGLLSAMYDLVNDKKLTTSSWLHLVSLTGNGPAGFLEPGC